VLRDVLRKTGTKFGCGQALCDACTVHVDGAATRSCITTVDSIGESAITTSVRLAARTGDGPEPMGPYPILPAVINRLSVSGRFR
jgi:aerobic-type carbon monoxide dehydrogenase small subunit (CoxS/CutS family)